MNTTLVHSNSYKTQDHSHKSLRQRYLDFCDQEEKERTLWFILPLMTLPAVIMPITIFMMSAFSAVYVYFVGASMLLFFANLIMSIAGKPTRVLISFFIFTLLFHFLMPLACFLVSLVIG